MVVVVVLILVFLTIPALVVVIVVETMVGMVQIRGRQMIRTRNREWAASVHRGSSPARVRCLTPSISRTKILPAYLRKMSSLPINSIRQRLTSQPSPSVSSPSAAALLFRPRDRSPSLALSTSGRVRICSSKLSGALTPAPDKSHGLSTRWI